MRMLIACDLEILITRCYVCTQIMEDMMVAVRPSSPLLPIASGKVGDHFEVMCSMHGCTTWAPTNPLLVTLQSTKDFVTST